MLKSLYNKINLSSREGNFNLHFLIILFFLFKLHILFYLFYFNFYLLSFQFKTQAIIFTKIVFINETLRKTINFFLNN